MKTIVVGHSVQRKSAKLDCPVALMHWMGCCTALRSRCDSNSLLQIIEVLATIGPGCHACLLVLGPACLLKTVDRNMIPLFSRARKKVARGR